MSECVAMNLLMLLLFVADGEKVFMVLPVSTIDTT